MAYDVGAWELQGGSNVTLALAGIGIVSATKTTIAGTVISLSGAASTLGTGTVAPSSGITVALTGATAQVLQTQASNGTVAFLSGAISALQAGSVAVSTGANTQLTGLAIVSQQGSVIPTGSSAVALSGSGVNVFQGNVTIASSNVTVPLSGATLTGLQTVLSVAVMASTSGFVSSVLLETLSTSKGGVLSGISTQALAGDILAVISVNANGSPVTVFAGPVITESGAESVDWVIVEHKNTGVLCLGR
jgi:hypothetical protein